MHKIKLLDWLSSRGLLWLSAIFAFVLCAMHNLSPQLFIEPLLESDALSETAKFLGHGNWNLFTLVTISQGVAFAITSFNPQHKSLGIFASVLALAVAANMLFLGVTRYSDALVFPGLYANLLMGTTGLIGSIRVKVSHAGAKARQE